MGNTGKGQDIWVKDMDRDTASRLSFVPDLNDRPVWTPDGKTIVFHSLNPDAPGLYAIRADGSGEAKRLTEGAQVPHSFSPDGKHLAISQTGNAGSFDIFTLPVESDAVPGAAGVRLGKAELFLGTPFRENSPAFSPDGRWLAYHSNDWCAQHTALERLAYRRHRLRLSCRVASIIVGQKSSRACASRRRRAPVPVRTRSR